MRLPIGSIDVSTSGGTAELIARRGEGWHRICDRDFSPGEAIALLDAGDHRGAHGDPALQRAVLSTDAEARRFAPGEAILWRYGRVVETARVIRDDARGLIVWIPSGSARLESVPADGRRTREVPLEERFSVPWMIRESTWTGPGVVRVAPSGRPWSVWFFRRPDGTPDGAYVNLELPHRRLVGASNGIVSRDLVLDLWVDAEHAGAEDVWLKDADELEAAVLQGRFTLEQAEAVRSIADRVGEELIASGGWPLDEGWESWTPDAAMDEPVGLPVNAAMDAARARSGRTDLEG